MRVAFLSFNQKWRTYPTLRSDSLDPRPLTYHLGAMGGALSRASRAVRAGPPPAQFPAPPRVPRRAAPAAVSEMEQSRSIEATLNQATISSSTVTSHGAAPAGMAQRNALVGELDQLQL